MSINVLGSAVIKQFLIDQGLGIDVDNSETDWQIFRGELPDIFNANILGVLDRLPRMDGAIMRTGEVVEHPGIQVRIRGKDYAIGEARSIAIREALDLQANNISVAVSGSGSYKIQRVRRTTGIIPSGKDEKHQKYFIINMTCTILQTG